MRRVIVFTVLLSLAIRNVQGEQSLWNDPSLADPDSLNVYYCEDMLPGDTLMTLVGEVENGTTFTITIENVDASAIFEIDGSDLKIKTGTNTSLYDYEGPLNIRNVSATLTYENGLDVENITVYLVVEDVNEFSPTFKNTTYEVSVSESISGGTSVLEVTATDDDGTSVISYQILELDNYTDFSIDPDTGIITYTPNVSLGDLSEVQTMTLQVQATDGNSSDSRNGNTTVVVQFIPVPAFIELSNPQDVSLDENTVGGIYTVNYTTAVGAVYELIVTNQTCDPPYFELDGNEVRTAANRILDMETFNEPCTLTFRLSDGVHVVDSETLSVHLNETNDNYPVFSEYNPTRKIPEHYEVGTEIYKVEATDADIGNPTNYMIYSLNGDGQEVFSINRSSGVISIAAQLDYNTKNVYNLTLTAADSEVEPLIETTYLLLEVITGPKFETPVDGDNITIAEVDTGDGLLATSLTVVDKDGDTPEITIVAQNPDDIFALSGNNLNWKQAVDFDADNAVVSYTVTLKTSDGDNKTLDDEITITINVEDSNDEPPVFADEFYSETVGEHLTVGKTVLTVEASDRDVTNEYSELVYSLLSGDDSHTDFNINMDTGVITVAKTLNYSLISTYSLTAMAKDISNNPKSSTVSVTFYVATGPEITSPQDGDEFIIFETDTVNGNPVVKVETSDEDKSGAIEIEVISQTPGTEPLVFEINSKGQLVPLHSVDADLSEEDPIFTLQIRASDGRPYSANHTITVNVHISDSNEAPTFQNGPETIDVPERTETGTIVYQANASDPDKTPEFRQILYTLSGGNYQDFKIFENGSLAILKQLDYSKARTHDVTIRASNTPDLKLETTMHLIIYVLTAPVFDNLTEPFTVEIPENGGIGNVFGLEVSDADGQERKTVIVTSIESQSPSTKFVLEGLSLKTIEGLDAEEEQEFIVTFKASDGKFETYSAELTVKVIDLNDNPPFIENIGDISVDENEASSGSGSEIVLLKATDGDATTANNMLTWKIISGNEDHYFSINETTGMLSLVKQPVSREPLEYTLTVEVADNGLPQLTDSTTIKISINGEAVDECAPSPCLHGGECTSYTNTYSCACMDGFEGDHCEINIDDCLSNPCTNEGKCIDGVNSFSCDCAEGWTGDTCSKECKNNKYGRNCVNTCECDVSRLAADAGNQMCDVKTGDCMCNEFWRGSKCEADIDECEESLHNCNNDPNSMCKNANGGFLCICKTKHTLVDNVCDKDPPRSVFPKDGEMAVLLKFKLDLPCKNLNDSEVYAQEEDRILIMLYTKLKGVKFVLVFDIWCGSIEFEATVIINDTADDRAELAKQIQEIRDASSIQYDGNDVPVLNVFVNDKELSPTSQSSETMETKVCDVFTSYTSCSTDEECRYEDGKPSCMPPKKDNLALILGLGLGLSLPLLFLTALAVVLWNMKRRHDLKRKRWERKMMQRRDGSFATRYYDNGKYSGGISHLSGFSNLPGEAVVTYPYKISA